MIEDLIKYFKETPREQILKEWNETDGRNIGMPISKFLKQMDFLDLKIEDSDLSIRTKNICRMNNLSTFRDVFSYTSKELLMLNFGKRSIYEIQELLIQKGYAFGS